MHGLSGHVQVTSRGIITDTFKSTLAQSPANEKAQTRRPPSASHHTSSTTTMCFGRLARLENVFVFERHACCTVSDVIILVASVKYTSCVPSNTTTHDQRSAHASNEIHCIRLGWLSVVTHSSLPAPAWLHNELSASVWSSSAVRLQLQRRWG